MRKSKWHVFLVTKETKLVKYECRQSIASMESEIQDNTSGTIGVHFANLSLVLGHNVYRAITACRHGGIS